MRNSQGVIPITLRNKILQELHVGHFGVIKMKNLARSYCWWLNINNNIESLVKNCYECNMFKKNPPKVTTHIWELPTVAMDRVHADFSGPFMGKMFFIMVDAFSKWPEINIFEDKFGDLMLQRENFESL